MGDSRSIIGIQPRPAVHPVGQGFQRVDVRRPRFGIMDISCVDMDSTKGENDKPYKVPRWQWGLLGVLGAVVSMVMGAALNETLGSGEKASQASASSPSTVTPDTQPTTETDAQKPATKEFTSLQQAYAYVYENKDTIKGFRIEETKTGNLRGQLRLETAEGVSKTVTFMFDVSQKEYQGLTQAMARVGIEPDFREYQDPPEPKPGWFNFQNIAQVILIMLFIGMIASNLYTAKLMRGQGGLNKKFDQKLKKPIRSDVKLDQVGGLSSNIKREIQYKVVNVLQRLKQGAESVLGERLPNGLLLYGPPGTGKTLLVRAISGETGIPAYKFSGSEFEEKLVGVGASRIRDVFAAAEKHANTHNTPVILFFDEMDALAKDRDHNTHGQQTLNQFLVEASDPRYRNKIFVIAATNKPGLLDSAAKRAGRFDIKIPIFEPRTHRQRTEILRIHLQGIKRHPDLDKEDNLIRVSKLMFPGTTGADIEQIVNDAALVASMEGKSQLDYSDLKIAMVSKNFGVDDLDTLELDQYQRYKKQLASHEWGHALMHWVQGDKVPIISVIPRQLEGAGVLGFVGRDPDDVAQLSMSYDYLMKELYVLMAGRAVEETHFERGRVTGGCANDFERANRMMRRALHGGQQLFAHEADALGFLQELKPPTPYGRSVLSETTQAKADAFIDNQLRTMYGRLQRFIESIPKAERDAMIDAIVEAETMDEPDDIHQLFDSSKADLKDLWAKSGGEPSGTEGEDPPF